jgi:hypothetical protein
MRLRVPLQKNNLQTRRHRYRRACKWHLGMRVLRSQSQLDLWHRRVLWLERTGRLSRAEARALWAARNFFNRRTGQCDPSHDAIAKKAAVCARTVQRALAKGKQYGVIAWDQRAIWLDGEGAQITNQYRLLPGVAAPTKAPAIDAPPEEAAPPEQSRTVKNQINPLGSSDSLRPLERALASLQARITEAGR